MHVWYTMHTYTHTHSLLEVSSFSYPVYFTFLKYLYTDRLDSEDLGLDEIIGECLKQQQRVLHVVYTFSIHCYKN